MANRFRSSRRWALSILASACAAAHALDIASAVPPIEVTDGQLTVGSRTLLLPPGRWYYVDHSQKTINTGLHFHSPEDTVYLVQTENGQIALSIRLVLLREDILASGWDFGCLHDASIYFKERTPSPGRSDCLTIAPRRVNDYDQFIKRYSPRAADWLAARGVTEPVAMIYARYMCFAANTYGVLGVLIPTAHFDSEASAIDWAESMRSALKPWFEHRVDEARLPAIAALPGAASAATPEAEAASSAASAP